MVGRKPIPAEVQMLQGDKCNRGMGKLAEEAARGPHPPRGLPDAPEHLNEVATGAWKVLSEALAVMQIDRRPDAVMLEGACVAYAFAVEADERLNKEGLIVGGLDEPRPHPCVGISLRYWAQVRAFCSEFGLSPASLTRVKREDAGVANGDNFEDDMLNAPRRTQ